VDVLPLDKIRVLDLTRLLPGPFCSLMLADMGATVIKVEDTALGDYLRWGTRTVTPTQSINFMALNRNKQSIKLNLKPKEGKEIFSRLVQTADVVLDGFRPGRLDRLSVGYEAMSKINPRIIYCAISGYGQDGPDKDRAGHDLNYLARAGMLGLFGKRNGDPSVPAAQIADLTGAYLAAIGVLSAVIGRATTGRGQFVDISMMDGVWPWMVLLLPQYWYDGVEPQRGGLPLGGALACYNVYECRDGRWLSLGALEPQFWATFCKMMGHEGWGERQRETEQGDGSVYAELCTQFRTKTRAEWIEFFAGADVCIEPIQTAAEATSDPHMQHRRMILEVDQPNAGPIRQIASPLKLSDICEPRREPSPEYGQHTEQVLREAGYSDGEIAAFKVKRVI
jgi:crotonobetainyl-CoA:carnitine CoA-transferase CaiB-like acyl-CoA transferase